MVPEIWSMTDKIFCHFGPVFALLPHQQVKKLKLWKNKKTPRDIIILHTSGIKENHMYGSWDTKRDKIFCHFGPFFAFFQNQNFEKMEKKHLKTYHHFTQV